jgi:hypothetical protein
MKTKPTFSYMPSEGNKKLYNLEEKLIYAVGAVAKHREEAYDEDLWKCAYPEAIHVILEGTDPNASRAAVENWLKNHPKPEEG